MSNNYQVPPPPPPPPPPKTKVKASQVIPVVIIVASVFIGALYFSGFFNGTSVLTPNTPMLTPTSIPVLTPTNTPMLTPTSTPVLAHALTGKIVFIESENEAGHQRAVYVMDTDGSNLTQLTDYSIGAQDPVWSPDGKKIAFASITDGGIYTINADGTNLTRIVYKTVYDVYTDTSHITANEHPSWSPDGSMIAYASFGDEDSGTTVANANIYVVNSDGTGIRRLTNDLSYEGQPSWSPDGNKIAFVHLKDEGDGYSNYHIYVMNADGSNWVQLTNRNITVNNQNPDWSPDGTKIIFTGDGDEHQGVFCINLNDKFQKFIGVLGGSPKWSPDGTKIITDGYESRSGYVRIWITNADGSNSKAIETPMDAYEPDWASQ